MWRQGVEDKLVALRTLIETRLDAMDIAAQVLSETVNRVPTVLDRETRRLQELYDQKIISILARLDRIQADIKDDKALSISTSATALAALKELIAQQNSASSAAIAKSETATASELTGLERAINSSKDALHAEITNLKQRVDRQDGIVAGSVEARKETQSSVGSVVGVVGGVTGVCSVAIMLILGLLNHAATTTTIPTVGADTRRVDDLITQSLARDHDTSARMDELSARIAALGDQLSRTPSRSITAVPGTTTTTTTPSPPTALPETLPP